MGSPAYQHGQWYIPDVDTNNRLELDGDGTFVRIPVSERLYPQGSPVAAPPQFVWDIAMNRVDDGIEDTVRNRVGGIAGNGAWTDAIRVVVFVRRLDIRLVAPIYRNLIDGTRRPVGVDATTGFPTNDGTGVYARPIRLDVEYRYNLPGQPDRNRLYIMGASADEWTIVRQVGQKLVDNLGNIHTVSGWSDTGARYVTLESPVTTGVTDASWGGAAGARVVNQVVLTPQIPAAVSVFRINP